MNLLPCGHSPVCLRKSGKVHYVCSACQQAVILGGRAVVKHASPECEGHEVDNANKYTSNAARPVGEREDDELKKMFCPRQEHCECWITKYACKHCARRVWRLCECQHTLPGKTIIRPYVEGDFVIVAKKGNGGAYCVFDNLWYVRERRETAMFSGSHTACWNWINVQVYGPLAAGKMLAELKRNKRQLGCVEIV